MNSTLILYDSWRAEGYQEFTARYLAECALRRKYPELDANAAAERLADALAERAESDRRFGQPHYGHDEKPE